MSSEKNNSEPIVENPRVVLLPYPNDIDVSLYIERYNKSENLRHEMTAHSNAAVKSAIEKFYEWISSYVPNYPDIIASQQSEIKRASLIVEDLYNKYAEANGKAIQLQSEIERLKAELNEQIRVDIDKIESLKAELSKHESDSLSIDDLLSEFNRQGFDTSNWDGEEGAETAIVDNVALIVGNLKAELEEVRGDARLQFVDICKWAFISNVNLNVSERKDAEKNYDIYQSQKQKP